MIRTYAKTIVRNKVVALVLALTTTAATMAQSTFGGGSGTEADPYRISQTTHLEQLAAEVNAGNNYRYKYFKMTNDLDFGDGSHTPIGCDTGDEWYDFEGIFDGGGYSILNARIEGSKYVGIFGRASTGTIKNLTLGGNSVVNGISSTGGIVGRGMAVNVMNCHVTKDVKINATGLQTSIGIGGIVGELEGGRYLLNDKYIRNCTNAAPITFKGTYGAQYMGGIIGYTRSEMGTTIENCYNVGAINPIGYGGTAGNCRFIGGVVGWQEAGDGTWFKDCYCGGDCTLPAIGIDGVLRGINISGEAMRMSRISFTSNINGTISTTPTITLDGNDYFASGMKVDMTLQYTQELQTGYTVSYSTTDGTLRPNGTGYTLSIGNADAQIRRRTDLTYRDIGYTPWISVSIPSQVYTGEPLTPEPVVTDSKDGTPVVLTKDKHFEVLEPDGGCMRPGNYTIIIKGIGSYDGQQAATFTINSPVGTWAGSGTQSSPYQICTLDDLKLLAENVNQGNNYYNVHFRMMNDIDNAGEDYTPIGTQTNPFEGTFDGYGYTISNFYINGYGKTYDGYGVFGYIGQNGTVRSLKVNGTCVYYSEQQYIGIIAGRNHGEITMCESTTTINVNGTQTDYIGGIAGYLGSTGTISYCTNNTDVFGGYLFIQSRYVGGIVGYNDRGTVESCFNYHQVRGQEYVGGIAGYNAGTINGCINNAMAMAIDKIGGIVGENAAGGTVKECLSLSATYDNNSVEYRGSIIGRNLGTASNNYYNFDSDTNASVDKNLGGINSQDVTGQAMRGWKITADDDLYFDLFPDDNGNYTGYTYDGIRYLGAGQSSCIVISRGTEFSNYTLQVSAGSIASVAGEEDMYLLTMPATGQDVHLSVAGDLTLNLLNDDQNDWYHNMRRIAFNEGFTGKVCLEGRTLYKNGQWNTLCLPFDVTLSGSVLDGAEARTLSGASFTDKTLTLTFDAVTTLKAGIPYIVRWNSGSNLVNPVFDNVTISNTLGEVEQIIDDGYEVTFCGNYNMLTFDDTDRSVLYLGANNTLYYPSSGVKIGGMRAYFQLIGITAGDKNGEASRFVLDLGDASTGIHEVRDTLTADAWYSLDGRRLPDRPTVRGIYIKNGKKVMVK